MMKLARRSLRTRRMILERMMVLMVKLKPHMYPLLPLDYGAGWSIPYNAYDSARSSGSNCLGEGYLQARGTEPRTS
jgi:hypothetical protein